MAVRITGSVGESDATHAAPNVADDVILIQRLFNAIGTRPLLAVNGVADQKLKDAITRFQSTFMSDPDGRIDPGGGTLRRLNRAANPSRLIFRLVVHHTAGSKNSNVEQIRRYHLSKGWRDIGYHVVIPGSGEIQWGRPENQVGAHAKGANSDSLGVSLCGNFENENPEPAQINSLILMLTSWCRRYVVSSANIIGHRDVGSTACPGRNLYPQLGTLRSRVETQLREEERRGQCLAFVVPAVPAGHGP